MCHRPFLFMILMLTATESSQADGPVRTRSDTQCESAADVARWKGTARASFHAMKARLDSLLATCEEATDTVMILSEAIAKLEKERRNLENWWEQETAIRDQLSRARAEPLGNEDRERRASAIRRNAERTTAVRNELEGLYVRLKEHEAACRQLLDSNLATELHGVRGSLTAATRCIDYRLAREGIR